MKSLRWRLTVWFALSLVLVVAGLVISAHWHLDYELRKEKWERSSPAHPDWVLHGSFTDQEVHDILGELLEFWIMIGVPLVGVALLASHFLAQQSLKPVSEVNQQLARLGPTTLGERLHAPDADPQIAQLVRHVNDLLARLETSFTQLQEYAGHVAHELRTPLQLMRLQVETHAAQMDPALAEGLQEELGRLSSYVETALTIARAERGRLDLKSEALALKDFLSELVEPFSRLALVQRRRLLWSCPGDATVWTDRGALKQILFNLLSNALKHGQGDILLRIRCCGNRTCFLLGNRRVAGDSTPAPVDTDNGTIRNTGGLGIGLRLVRALVGQLDGAQFAVRRGEFFWVSLRLPGGPGPAASLPAAGMAARAAKSLKT